MAKDAYYFSHDFGARNDPKLQKVLMKLGQEGKGVFWDLIEMLFEEGGKLLISECESYAFALRTNESCIKSLVNDFGLFSKDKVNFWSESVNRRLEQKNSKSEKARLSAMDRWNKDANASTKNANALRIVSESNAIKESKGKEKKLEDIKLPFSDIDLTKKRKLFIAPTINEIKLIIVDDVLANKFLNHYTSNGWKVGKNKMVDWKATANNWVLEKYQGQKNQVEIKNSKADASINSHANFMKNYGK